MTESKEKKLKKSIKSKSEQSERPANRVRDVLKKDGVDLRGNEGGQDVYVGKHIGKNNERILSIKIKKDSDRARVEMFLEGIGLRAPGDFYDPNRKTYEIGIRNLGLQISRYELGRKNKQEELRNDYKTASDSLAKKHATTDSFKQNPRGFEQKHDGLPSVSKFRNATKSRGGVQNWFIKRPKSLNEIDRQLKKVNKVLSGKESKDQLGRYADQFELNELIKKALDDPKVNERRKKGLVETQKKLLKMLDGHKYELGVEDPKKELENSSAEESEGDFLEIK